MNKDIRNSLFFGFIVIVIGMLPGCWPWSSQENTQTQVAAVDAQKNNSLKIVDVNEEKIYKDAHIAGALHIPYDKLEEAVISWDKNAPIVIYCTTFECTESHRAAKKLIGFGFTNVRVYEGGMNDWYKHAQKDKAAYPYEGIASENYLTKQVSKPEGKESEIPSITSEELSKQMEEVTK